MKLMISAKMNDKRAIKINNKRNALVRTDAFFICRNDGLLGRKKGMANYPYYIDR